MGAAWRKRLWGWPVLVAGTLLGVVSLLADVVGVGGFAGFGWKQGLGVILAFALVLLGVYGVLGEERAA